jgi:hypothetical protein
MTGREPSRLATGDARRWKHSYTSVSLVHRSEAAATDLVRQYIVTDPLPPLLSSGIAGGRHLDDLLNGRS